MEAPGALQILKLMMVVWQKQAIPRSWRRAGGVLIPKERNSITINQFHHINILNIEGSIFVSVLACRLASA